MSKIGYTVYRVSFVVLCSGLIDSFITGIQWNQVESSGIPMEFPLESSGIPLESSGIPLKSSGISTGI